MFWYSLVPWNKYCSEKPGGSWGMQNESATTDWPFEKGLAVTQFLKSLGLEASPHHSDQACGGRVLAGCAVT